MSTIHKKSRSQLELNKLYFFTATINNWNYLLLDTRFKQNIVESLSYLKKKNKIKVYGFVIMPNHVHIIWYMIEKNGKELPSTSFLKFTAKCFLKHLRTNNPELLKHFEIVTKNKSHLFWQSNSYSFELKKRETAIQKLNYIHNNPISKHWKLVKNAEEYYFSSAQFYMTGRNNFDLLEHLYEIL